MYEHACAFAHNSFDNTGCSWVLSWAKTRNAQNVFHSQKQKSQWNMVIMYAHCTWSIAHTRTYEYVLNNNRNDHCRRRHRWSSLFWTCSWPSKNGDAKSLGSLKTIFGVSMRQGLLHELYTAISVVWSETQHKWSFVCVGVCSRCRACVNLCTRPNAKLYVHSCWRLFPTQRVPTSVLYAHTTKNECLICRNDTTPISLLFCGIDFYFRLRWLENAHTGLATNSLLLFNELDIFGKSIIEMVSNPMESQILISK